MQSSTRIKFKFVFYPENHDPTDCTFWLTKDMQNFIKVNEVYGSYFANGEFPARICYAVK